MSRREWRSKSAVRIASQGGSGEGSVVVVVVVVVMVVVERFLLHHTLPVEPYCLV